MSESPSQTTPIYPVKWSKSSQAMVFDPDTVMHLRQDFRIVGSLEGSHPSNPLQNNYFGLPLVLLPEETAILLEDGVIASDADCPMQWPSTERERLQYMLYKDLYKRGYYITRGLKFGGDYLLYPGEPLRYHSSHVVTLVEHARPTTPRELVALGRLGTAVKKTRVLSSWDPQKEEFIHVTLKWSGI